MASQIVLVTGANRGIGYSIVQGLSRQASNNVYLLGVRSPSGGAEAIERLRDIAPSSTFHTIELDLSSDESVRSAVASVEAKYGRLDVLVNNAGIATRPAADNSDAREIYTKMFDTNITAPILLTEAFLPLLRSSSDPRVIMVSSVRGSFARVLSGANPKVALLAYLVSKSALNMATVELGVQNPDILFHAACPGHCKTAFNGYKGLKDPLDGARVVVELATSPKDRYPGGFYEYEEGGIRAVPY